MGSTEGAAAFIPRVLVTGAAVFIGLALIGLALPRAAAYYHAVSWRSLSLARPSAADTAAESKALLSAYRAATTWQPGDATLQKLHGQQALLELGHDKTNIRALKTEAATSLALTIAAAPDNVCAWASYAYAGNRYDLPGVAVGPSIRLAYILSPPAPSCAGMRLSVMLAHPDAIPDDLKPYVIADIEALWLSLQYHRSTDLVYVYRDAPPQSRALIKETVATATPRGQRAFDALIKGPPSR